jgi:hypothetical protein
MTKKNKTKIENIEIHYSMCKAYLRGNIEDVANMYYGLPTYSSDAMKKGIKIHEKISSEKLRLFEDMGECDWEFKKEKKISDRITYVGTVDCIDWSNHIIYDWKSGTTDVTKIDPMQLYCYSLLFDNIQKGRMVKVDQVGDEIVTGDWVEYYITPLMKDKALNWIDTLGLEIINVLNNMENKEEKLW